ncbi:hypothetical protein MMC30_002522 [Trapelia coarctata]|nr:hypothetical protein [Trapelia coarctata]
MFLALVWISLTPSQTYAIEAFLLLQLLLVTWFVGVKDRSRWSVRYWKYEPVRSIIRETSVIAILAYNVWFWWDGLDAFRQNSCTTYAFFLSKVDLYGWFRSAHKVLSIIAFVFQSIQATGDIFQLLNHWRTRKIRNPKYFSELAERLLQESDTSRLLATDEQTPSLKGKVVYHDSACSPIIGLDQKTPVIPYDDATSNHFNDNLQPAKPPSEVHVTVGRMETSTYTELTLLSATSSAQHSPANPSPSHSSLERPHNPAFDALHEADNYLTSVLSPPSQPPTHTSYHFPHTPITIHLPSLPSLRPPSLPLIYQHFPHLLPLFIHIYSLRTYPYITYPSLLHRATTSPHIYTGTLSPLTLSTFLTLRTSTLPPTNRKALVIPNALGSLCCVIGLLLAVELCIVWNGISGVRDMGTVGQLVPFLVGVGGLVIVGWTWALEGGVGRNGEEGDRGLERCAEVYFRVKAERGREE